MKPQYLIATDGPEITALVVPTLEALGEQPWQVTLYTDGKQLTFYVIEAASGLEAATAAVDDWLEENGYKNSTILIQTL